MGKGLDYAGPETHMSVFLRRTENLRPYLKFEKAFNEKFAEAYEKFERFKTK